MKRGTSWVVTVAAAAVATLGVVLSHRVEPGVRVEAVTLAEHTPALRFFPSTAGSHPVALLVHGLALSKDYQPLTDMRASSDYRLDTAKSLLYRFWLETRPHGPLDKSKLDVRAIELVEAK